jgi:hypothetical protein
VIVNEVRLPRRIKAGRYGIEKESPSLRPIEP